MAFRSPASRPADRHDIDDHLAGRSLDLMTLEADRALAHLSPRRAPRRARRRPRAAHGAPRARRIDVGGRQRAAPGQPVRGCRKSCPLGIRTFLRLARASSFETAASRPPQMRVEYCLVPKHRWRPRAHALSVGDLRFSGPVADRIRGLEKERQSLTAVAASSPPRPRCGHAGPHDRNL